MERETTAIVWDIDNVTPSINSTFLKGLLDFVSESGGRVGPTRVCGDWSRTAHAAVAGQLIDEGLELIHLPRSLTEREKLIAGHMLGLPALYPTLRRLILISGSAYFRYAVRAAASRGIHTRVICDAKNAEEELLMSADEFGDFRDYTVLPVEETVSAELETRTGLDESFILLREAVDHIEARDKPSTVDRVKVRLKLMNEQFDETSLGFASWQDYLAEAEKRGLIHIRFREHKLMVSDAQKKDGTVPPRPAIIVEFLKALDAAATVRTSEGSKAKLSDIGGKLEAAGVDFRRHGYSRLKKLADAAAKRGLVHISLKESSYLLGLTKGGEECL